LSTSLKNYVFIDEYSIVVQAIVGDLSTQDLESFLAVYRDLFGAVAYVENVSKSEVGVGSLYLDDGTFMQPPGEEPDLVEEPLLGEEPTE
jgi:hypothetical protein